MTPHSHEFEVVWTGEMERQAIEAQRRFADPNKAAFRAPSFATNTNQRVMAYLKRYPNATMIEIVTALGVSKGAVNGALHRLLELGYVARSHSQKQHRREHIRWRAL